MTAHEAGGASDKSSARSNCSQTSNGIPLPNEGVRSNGLTHKSPVSCRSHQRRTVGGRAVLPGEDEEVCRDGSSALSPDDALPLGDGATSSEFTATAWKPDVPGGISGFQCEVVAGDTRRRSCLVDLSTPGVKHPTVVQPRPFSTLARDSHYLCRTKFPVH